jgi:hypothetical protein
MGPGKSACLLREGRLGRQDANRRHLRMKERRAGQRESHGQPLQGWIRGGLQIAAPGKTLDLGWIGGLQSIVGERDDGQKHGRQNEQREQLHAHPWQQRVPVPAALAGEPPCAERKGHTGPDQIGQGFQVRRRIIAERDRCSRTGM